MSTGYVELPFVMSSPVSEPSVIVPEERHASVLATAEPVPEVVRLQAELDRLMAQQTEIMALLGTKRADRIIHDLRNLLQERIFLEAAVRQSDRP